MHSRSIEFGKKFSVPIHVRSSFTDIPGTMIVADPESPDQAVGGAALVKNEARVTIQGVPDRPGTSLAIFSKLAAKNISVDMIVQNVGAEGKADISFTVIRDDLRMALEALQEAATELGAEGTSYDEDIAKVSVVGLGMATQTGVAQQMFSALAQAEINISMITTSEIKISVLVARDQGLPALRTVHRTFHLEKEPERLSPTMPAKAQPASSAVDIVARLQRMEDLAIDDISLDETQARVTITGVPDSPGVAARVFERVAAGGIFVDMIVQSCGLQGKANLSFTVPQAALDRAVAQAAEVSRELNCGPVTSSARVAKLSVSGIGLRSHTGVAIRMFQSLAQAGINVEMINTSEVRVNVVVDGRYGKQALASLNEVFKDVLR
jgi:aspartate kinase